MTATLRSEIKSAMQVHAPKHVPTRTRRITWRIHTASDFGAETSIGLLLDVPAVEGRVVDRLALASGEVLLVATGRTSFAAIDCALMAQAFRDEVRVGDSVTIEPYARRRFSGERCDAPIRHADGVVTHILGGCDPCFPGADAVQCPQLRELIRQLSELRAPDGFRRIAHVLIDAGARAVTYSDPSADKLLETPPSITVDVSTAKHQGKVAISYLAVSDYYAIELLDRNGQRMDIREDVDFTQLGDLLVELIDDGSWRTARAAVTKRCRPRVTRQAA